ncbi:MAG: 2-oxoglutarate dehydrogenase E1 component [Chthoniobacterales bacterium]|nr:2-oxoglutarate dehydrogenase E1 component [Chthoniobacterales bacterium]
MSQSVSGNWNSELLEQNYARWKQDTESVAPEWNAFFEGFELGLTQSEELAEGARAAVPEDAALERRADSLAYSYRTLGHTIARLDPLTPEPPDNPLLSLKGIGFADSDIERTVRTKYFRDGKPMLLREMLAELRAIYSDTIGAEFMHIQDPRVRNWIRERIENRGNGNRKDAALQRAVLRQLYEAETFEHFLHTRYVGQKRFSLEGAESLLVILDTILQRCEPCGVQEIVMGMAHRGRLNVLANFLNKPLTLIFNEFSENYIPDVVGGNGDVKYHLGYHSERETATGYKVGVRLAPNPSHLEAVDPVVEGMARARQRILGDMEKRGKVLPLLVHGDAAFAGQGIVAEVFQMSQLPGYCTGGTLHIVVNNQIGFTTLPADARSSLYPTDVAKMIEAPVFHVNGEDPLAVVTVAQIALDFRQEFGRDVVIDLFCYRRHGHNEGDEPTFTQPHLYSAIQRHPLASETFVKELTGLGTLTAAEGAQIKAEASRDLEEAFDIVKKSESERKEGGRFAGSTAVFQPPYSYQPVHTEIAPAMLKEIVGGLCRVPPDFHLLPKVRRMLIERRLEILRDGGPYDWAFSEALAFGSLLLEGTPLRLSGQDCRRGTFSQRHAVFYDAEEKEDFIPLNHLKEGQAKLCVYNSLLSEVAVLGFDYGYSLDYPSMLCLWEAQFGDFANGAQVIIDQFISSAESKWQRPSSLVLLLPHGFEGQGPEHSSARLERFLQLCADNNMQICNLTTPAQYFHALRRQIHRDYRKPLVIMTPKSLLRHAAAVSKAADFTGGRFYAIMADPLPADAASVTRMILCSGKVYYDLKAEQEKRGATDSTILRVEQIYPLHVEKIKRIANACPNLKRVVWCQEEPQNMGAWFFMQPRLRELLGRNISYAGRPESPSPAVGSLAIHRLQQAELVSRAFEV